MISKQEWTAWEARWPWCWNCGRHGACSHHIVRGGNKYKVRVEPRACLRLCVYCHTELHSTGKWSLPRELSLKRKMDPDNWDLAAINGWRPNGEKFDEADIDRWEFLERNRP